MKIVLQIVGVLAVLMGLLWIGQGLGLIRWPASRVMIAERQGIIRGALRAAVGAALLARSRRRS